MLTLALAAAWLLCVAAARHATAQIFPGAFRNFESPQVHPLALTPDGTRLLAVNSPNATLSVFQLSSGSPVLTAEIPVGLEPVSVAARNDREAWVVNWLSDSVSVVDLTSGAVVRTIGVGDEPTDVLFAGANNERAFVCVSGGPRHGLGDEITNTGTGQVLVFDVTGPTALFTLNIPAKQPRALARDASGSRVFVSVFESGNQTTVVPEPSVRLGGGLPPPSPAMASGLPAAPSSGLVVKWSGSHWVDELSRAWDSSIPYSLPDADVFVIDAVADPIAVSSDIRGVGTHVGNMAFDPVANRVVAANLEDINQVRFEPNLRGRFQHSRVSIFDPAPGAASPAVFDLNPHVNLSGPGSNAERAQSLAFPADIVRAADGTLYVAATSSARVGVLDPAAGVVGRVAVGQGPTGLALSEARQRLYVLNRFDHTVGIVDTNTRTQLAAVGLGQNPMPAPVRAGRKLLFDASLSTHGTVSCASCHPGGHRDGMVWDLGDPQGATETVQGTPFHPMKGPMMTQSLRAIIGVEPFHWRGDRVNLAAFNPAFVSLLGSARLLTPQEMADFTAFVQSLAYPPNPNENENRTLSAKAQRGFNSFNSSSADRDGASCNACHFLSPFSNGAGGIFVAGTGTTRFIFPATLIAQPQPFKVTQLRGLYQKAGMSRAPGEQATGFGFVHDGSFGTMFDFLKGPAFNFPAGQAGDDMRRDIETFMLQLDTGLAPSVGMQATLGGANGTSPEAGARVQFLAQQAAGGNCDLVVRGLYGGSPRAFLRLSSGAFQPDSTSEALVTLQQLTDAAAAGAGLTFTGVAPGEGRRFSIDADGDGLLNDDEPRTSVSIEGRVLDDSGQGLAGVVVALSGSQAASAVTDSSGRYVFNFVSTAGAHTVTPQGQGVGFTPASRTFTNPSWNQSAIFVASPTANAADASAFFVAQHYRDFLNREPDAPGLAFWTNEIEQCGANAQCREVKRINVSAAFFLSIEFQTTSFLVYRASKVSFGDLAGKPTPATFERLMTDAQRVGRDVVVGRAGWEQLLETNKQAFFVGWVQRPEFLARYPTSLSPLDFVNALNSTAGFPLTPAERDALVAQLASNNTTQGRASVLRQMSENPELTRRELNRAFVLMQYFGYLRRNPDDAPEQNLNFDGYNFWLTKLNDFNGNFVNAEMVKAFITSVEYRGRFGRP